MLKKALAIATISLAAANVSAYEKPSVYQRSVSGTQIVCIPSIDDRRRLIETEYGEINDGRRNYLILIREKVIMEQATPKDLQWYKTDCSPKQPVILGDILR